MKLGRLIRHNIIIEPSSNNGFVVHVGCGKFVAPSVDSLINCLSRYLQNPDEYEKEYANLQNQPETVSVAPSVDGDTSQLQPTAKEGR